MTRKRTAWKTAWRAAVCLAAAACALPLGGAAWLPGLVPSLSPYNALLAVAAGAGGLYLLGAAAVALCGLLSPRAFCRWLCPTGACLDAATALSKRRPWVERAPRLGPWLLFLGAGAALTGYPLFGWLDPLVLFNAAFGVAGRMAESTAWFAAAGLPLLALVSLAAPGLWCGRLCPLGALQDVLRAPWRLRPAARETAAPSALGRRAFIGLGAGAGYRLALWPARGAPPNVLRPPACGGAARFTRLCVRCGACVRACPSGILRFGGTGSGWAGVLAPELTFENGYCHPSCMACGLACPSGAIPKVAADDKFARPLGVARVDRQRCLLNQGRECGACATACPREALDLVWEPSTMSSRVVVRERRCTGCGYCEYVCVSAPKAITVKALMT